MFTTSFLFFHIKSTYTNYFTFMPCFVHLGKTKKETELNDVNIK